KHCERDGTSHAMIVLEGRAAGRLARCKKRRVVLIPAGIALINRLQPKMASVDRKHFAVGEKHALKCM
ncbi:MAG: hypothetical protein R3D62_13085, partial [Xanthobacteraceae bacterium]